MSLFQTISYLICGPVVAYFVFATVHAYVGSRRTLAALRGLGPGASASGARFVVLMPMLREDRVVREACEYLARVAKDGVAVQVIIATTEREEQERDEALVALRAVAERGELAVSDRIVDRGLTAAARGAARQALEAGRRDEVFRLIRQKPRPTTAEVAAAVVAELNGSLQHEVFFHVTAPASSLGKVGQLNSAYRAWLVKQEECDVDSGRPDSDDPVYIGVYDADSKPDPAAFAAMAGIVRARSSAGSAPPEIFQSVSCYCRGLAGHRGVRAALALSDAIAQTRWALGFEYELYQRYARRARTGRLRPLAYCIGHGSFVSSAFLARIDGFPTLSPNDDLALGYQASLLGAEVLPVPALDYCDVAPDSLSSVRQSRFWYRGSARFAVDLRAFRDESGHRPGRVQWWTLLATGHGRNVAWAWRATAWLVALGMAGAGGNWAMFAVLAVVHLAYVQGGFLQTWRQLYKLPGAAELSGVRHLRRTLVVGALFAASATFVIRSLGPLLGSLEVLARRAPAQAWKTER